jgi:hypothetical protein
MLTISCAVDNFYTQGLGVVDNIVQLVEIASFFCYDRFVFVVDGQSGNNDLSTACG